MESFCSQLLRSLQCVRTYSLRLVYLPHSMVKAALTPACLHKRHRPRMHIRRRGGPLNDEMTMTTFNLVGTPVVTSAAPPLADRALRRA